MSDIFFSVIIPVYNTENYLDQCITSVLNQTLTSYELILVDDGSTDGSGNLCHYYAKLDDRVRLYQKSNGGLSSARNVGIRNAKGEYIVFLDSDDYWDNANVLRDIHDTICANKVKLDIVSFSSKWLLKDGTLRDDGFHFPVSACTNGTCDDLLFMLQNNLINASACSKAIQREFIVNNDLYFKEGVRCEDIEWIIRASILLPRYAFLNKHLYIYRKQREGSITFSVNEKHVEQYLHMLMDFCEMRDGNTNEAFELMLNYVAFQYTIVMGYISNCKKSDAKKRMIENSKKLVWLFNYRLHPKVKLIARIYRVAGYSLTSKMLGRYIIMRNRGEI